MITESASPISPPSRTMSGDASATLLRNRVLRCRSRKLRWMSVSQAARISLRQCGVAIEPTGLRYRTGIDQQKIPFMGVSSDPLELSGGMVTPEVTLSLFLLAAVTTPRTAAFTYGYPAMEMRQENFR